MNQPNITKPAVCVMLSLFMHGALGAWIVHTIQPTNQNWQPIRPIQVSLVSELLDPATGNETGQIDQISEVAPGPASTSSDFESTPIQEAEIEQKTDPVKPSAESEIIREVRRPQESYAYEPDLLKLEPPVSESKLERMQIQDDAVERMAITPVTESIDPVETQSQNLFARYPDKEEFDFDDLQTVWTEIETSDPNPVESLLVAALTTELNIEQVRAETEVTTDVDAERAVWNGFESEMAVSIDKLVSFQPFEKSVDPVETEPQILSTRYVDNDEFDMDSWQSTATMIDEFTSENSNTSELLQQDIQQEYIDFDDSRAVWSELETNEANPVESLQVVALTTEFNAEQVQTESVEITDLDAERVVWNELESEITSHTESLQLTVLTVNTRAGEVKIDTENSLASADQNSGMYFEPEDYRDLTPPVSIQEPSIEMAASTEVVSQHPEEPKESAETQIEVENIATTSDFEREVAHLNFPDTEQIEFIAFNAPDPVLEDFEPEQSDQLDLNKNVGIEGQPENEKIASFGQKQQPELMKIENLQGSKASSTEKSVAQSTLAKKVVPQTAQTKPTLENEIAPPAKDRNRKEESPNLFATLNHSKQQNGGPNFRGQSNDHSQTVNLGAASLPSSSQPRFGVEGLANPAPRYPYLSRSREEEGKVILQVYVNKKGRTSRIETIQSSGHSRLDQAARKAVKNWTFTPALEDGNPTAGVVQVPILFVLKN